MSQLTLSLDAEDTAIILKKDGTFETSFPDVSTDVLPDHVVMGAALAYALKNEDMCNKIRDFFEGMCARK